MRNRAIQDFYPEKAAVCFGCGPHNPEGLTIQTYWDGAEGVCHFAPQKHHTAFPGVVYGGLIACLIDCHSIGTAIAATYEAEGRMPGTDPKITYVTGTLQVRYIRTAPIGGKLTLRAQVEELHEKKAIVTCSLYAKGEECARGEVIAVRAPWNVKLGG
jgi:acyl-coenzyme A thioesterase PaaI-like protein